MSDTNPRAPLPPYLAFQTIKSFLAGMKEAGLPGRIDKSVMGTMSGATQSSLLLTLKFLKLIDDEGKPSAELAQLVKGDDESNREVYAHLIATRYAFVSEKLDLATATQHQLDEVFQARDLGGDTLRKAVSFFILMASEAGLKVSPHIKGAKRKGSGGGVRRSRKRSSGVPEDDDNDAPKVAPSTPATIDPPGHKTYPLDLSPDGSRVIRVTAPVDLKEDEIERLAGWMKFQFNVGWQQSSSPK